MAIGATLSDAAAEMKAGAGVDERTSTAVVGSYSPGAAGADPLPGIRRRSRGGLPGLGMVTDRR
jgi:hypothetical protein